MNTQTTEKSKDSGTENKSMGPMIAIIVILIAIVLGGLFVWKMQNKDKSYEDMMENKNDKMMKEENMMKEKEMMMIKEQGSSDELLSIEADIMGTNINDLDKELNSIDAELQVQ